MLIPKKFKLGGLIWEVITTNHLLDIEDNEQEGLTRSSKFTIILNLCDATKQSLELTFLHELGHAILRSFNPYTDMLSLDDEEAYAQTFALGYYNFLISNYDLSISNHSTSHIDTDNITDIVADYDRIKRIDHLNCEYKL